MKRIRLFGIIALAVMTTTLTGCGTYKENLASNLMGQLNARFQVIRSPQQQFYDLTTGAQVKVEPTNHNLLEIKTSVQCPI